MALQGTDSLPAPSLAVMVLLTQRLPVRLIPEQRKIAAMVSNVIHDFSRFDTAIFLAVNTEGIAGEELKALLTPAAMAIERA